MPLRLTTLHFEQRFLIDEVTFIILLLAIPVSRVIQPKVQLYLLLNNTSSADSNLSQYQWTFVCNGHAVLKMSSQFAVC